LKTDLEKNKDNLPALIGLLKVLQRKQINSDLLRNTKIGKTVSNLANATSLNPNMPEEER
jgi:hypothetical protein